MLKKILLALVLIFGVGVTLQAKPSKHKKQSGFTMWQLPMQVGNIGNSYVFRTAGGKVIVFDGGWPAEQLYLRGFIAALGNEVEAWFISHPHDDHMGVLWQILKDRQGMKINHIYHSRYSNELLDLEKPYNEYAKDFYAVLDTVSIPVTDIPEPGYTGSIDGFNFKVLGVVNEEFHTNPFNNSSMVMKVWDDKKSILFLADTGAESGNKLLNGPYRNELSCDYVQMAHHGQHGCTEDFYKSIDFRACLWPTAYWIWTNNQGGGYNTGTLETMETRRWMDEIGIKEHHVSCLEGLFQLD